MTKRHQSIQFHWFLMLVMPVDSIKAPMAVTEGVIPVMSFNSHILVTIHTQVTGKLHCHFSWETWCLCVVSKEKNTIRELQCNYSSSTTPSTKEVRKHTDIVQFELINQLRVFFPLSEVPKVLGGGEDRKQASFLLPKPKNNWDSIAATFKPHNHSITVEIFKILWAKSQNSCALPIIFLSLPKWIRRLCQESLLFWG